MSVDELIKQMESPDYLKDQIKKIEDSFVDNINLEYKHPTNPKLKAVEVNPIYPNEELWGNQYLEFVFDSDPAIVKNKTVVKQEFNDELNDIKRSNSIIKSYTAKDNTSFLAYFTPNINEPMEPNTNEDLEFEWIREYSFRITPDEVQYVFIQKDENIEYCELKNKIQMNKLSKSNNEDVGKIKLTPSTGLTDYYKQQREEELKKIGKNEDISG